MKSKNLDLKGLSQTTRKLGAKLRPYAGFMIFLFFAAIYTYLILQIGNLGNPQVSDSDVAAAVQKLPSPKIDQESVDKLLSLQDNSVNVQSLFDQNRTNPFGE
jgi:hypothetical protein